MNAPALAAVETVRLAAFLADAAVKGAAVLLLAGAASLLLRKSSASLRHMTWTMAVVAIMLVPLMSLALPQLQVPLLPDWAGSGVLAQSEQPLSAAAPEPPDQHRAEALPPAEPADTSAAFDARPQAPPVAIAPPGPTDVEPASFAEPSEPLPAAPAEALASPPRWTAWALAAWLAGAMLLLGPLLAGTFAIRRRIRRSERIESGRMPDMLQRLRRQLGVRRRVVLLKSDWSGIPLTCGIFRPVIILPAEADRWSDERLRMVLLHELAHIRRADCLTQLLARVARVIYWFNPLVWLAGRMLRIERERACDDLVLTSGLKASTYAQHLLDIVRSLHSVRCPSLAAVAMARKSHFEGRLLAILDPRRSRRALTRLGVLLAAVLVVAVAVPLACLRATARDSEAPAEPPRGDEHTLEQPASESRDAALHVALPWLGLLDEGKTQQSWQEAAELFRKAISSDEWTEAVAAARGPLGEFRSRDLISATYATSLPGAPDGEYVVIRHEAVFENKRQAIETLTATREADGAWRISGYYVR